MRVVAVIPAYNEEGRVGGVIDALRCYSDEIIVVNDGSTDQTATIASRSGARVLSHLRNCGAGAATMTGLYAARALCPDVVITIDADEQHDSQDIPALLTPIRNGSADIVFANRFGQRNRIPLIRRIFNFAGNIVTFLATGLWVADSQCGFKAFGPRAIAEIHLRMRGFEFCTEIVRETRVHHWRFVEVPVKVVYSEYTLAKGQSFAGGVKTALRILLRSFLR